MRFTNLQPTVCLHSRSESCSGGMQQVPNRIRSDKMPCTEVFVNKFLSIPLLYQPCCPVLCCQGKQKTVYTTYCNKAFCHLVSRVLILSTGKARGCRPRARCPSFSPWFAVMVLRTDAILAVSPPVTLFGANGDEVAV